jgi:hypothetical protein
MPEKTAVATLLPLEAGHGLRGYLPERLPDVLAGLLLVALRLINIWLDRRRRRRASQSAKVDAPAASAIGWRETLAVAAALSINNVGLGLAGGIAGLRHRPVALSVAGFSVLPLWLGQHLSRAVALPTGAFGWLTLDGNILILATGLCLRGLESQLRLARYHPPPKQAKSVVRVSKLP